jgi:hypothetical protein
MSCRVLLGAIKRLRVFGSHVSVGALGLRLMFSE